MTNLLLGKLELLKSLLQNNPLIQNLDFLDKELSSSEEIMKLSYKMDMASVEYSDAIKYFSENSPEVKSAQKKLYAAKLELDRHPLVKRYNKAYLEVKNLYAFINKEIFGDFSL